MSWLSSLHCNSRRCTERVRVGSVAVEHSSVAPGTLMGNPTCLSTLYETSSYPTAPLWRRHWPRHMTVLCALPWKSYALSVDLFWSGVCEKGMSSCVLRGVQVGCCLNTSLILQRGTHTESKQAGWHIHTACLFIPFRGFTDTHLWPSFADLITQRYCWG